MQKICSVRGCRRRARVKGFCASHYERHRTGQPLERPIAKCVKGPIEKRLRAHVKIDKKTGCHLWTGYRGPRDYGVIWVGRSPKFAHRVAWELKHGPVPDGMVVMHTCDNPPCCNPEHLVLGTPGDNNRDRVKKGRGKGARALDLVKHPQWGQDFRAAARAGRGDPPQRIPSLAKLEGPAAAGSADVKAQEVDGRDHGADGAHCCGQIGCLSHKTQPVSVKAGEVADKEQTDRTYIAGVCQADQEAASPWRRASPAWRFPWRRSG
jgi:hypothetical protein